jgi:hypothetical protein
MVQELGETVNEMMKDDDQDVQDILNARPKGHYWVVIHHKKSKMRMKTGEQVLMRLVKAYDTEPRPLLGTVILEVREGEIVSHKINLHDAPINWGAIESKAGLIETPYVQQRPDLKGSYVFNN